MQSIVEAKNNLSALIDRALAGEEIIITRHGTPVVTLKPIKPKPPRMTAADFEWLDRHRVTFSDGQDAGDLLRIMRDEDDARFDPVP